MRSIKDYLHEDTYTDLHNYYVKNFSNKWLEKCAGDWYDIYYIFKSKYGYSCSIKPNRRYRYLPDITYSITDKKFTLNPGGYGSLGVKEAKEWIDQQNAAFMFLNTLNNIAGSRNTFPDEPEV